MKKSWWAFVSGIGSILDIWPQSQLSRKSDWQQLQDDWREVEKGIKEANRQLVGLNKKILRGSKNSRNQAD